MSYFKNNKGFGLIIGVLLTAVIIALMFYFVVGKKSDKNNAGEIKPTIQQGLEAKKELEGLRKLEEERVKNINYMQ